MGRPRHRLELLGVAEAAEMLGIGKAAVVERRRRRQARGPRFPDPVAELRCGPIWLRSQIHGYLVEQKRYAKLDYLERFRYDESAWSARSPRV